MTHEPDTLGWARRTTTSYVTDAADPPRILIVDDEESIRIFASRALQQAGYQTLVAANGRAALDLAIGRHDLNLLLTDLAMPDMRGDELAHLMRARDPDLKVLYLTGYRDRLFTKKGALWNGEAFLDKPCNVDALLEAVALLLFDHLLAPSRGLEVNDGPHLSAMPPRQKPISPGRTVTKAHGGDRADPLPDPDPDRARGVVPFLLTLLKARHFRKR